MEMSRPRRLCQTMLAFLVAATEGAFTGILGPTLPALQCLFTTNLQTISSIFFVFGMMNCLGSLLGCYILTKVNLLLVLVFVILVASANVIAFPFVSNVFAAIALAAIIAVCVGIMFNCRMMRCNSLWPEHAVPLHVVIAGFGIGSIAASLVAAPFLHAVPHKTYSTASKHQEFPCTDHYERVRYAYIILAVLGIPLSACFLFSYIRQRREKKEAADDSALCTSSSPNKTFKRGYIPFLLFFFLLCTAVGSIFSTYGNLLTTYGMSSTLKVSTQHMSFLTALFWASFSVGRLLMAAISICVKQIWLIVLGYVGMFTSITVLLLYGDASVASLAVGTALFGLFSSPFSALTFAWAREYIPLTGFVITVGSVGEYTGAMIGPYIGGVLLAVYGADAFMYVVVSIVAFQFLVFSCLYLVARFLLVRTTRGEQEVRTNGYEPLDEKSSEFGDHQQRGGRPPIARRETTNSEEGDHQYSEEGDNQ